MNCCVDTHVAGADRFFSWFAGRYRRRYNKKGLDRDQRQLLQGLLRVGLTGASILEVGCGVGYLHQRLLHYGAARATGIDLSRAMLDVAEDQARQFGLTGRVEYLRGDFVALADTVAPHDIVVLDKVLCCYPDAVALLDATAGKTRRACALIYPRAHLVSRAAMLIGAAFTRLIGCGFRGYVHDPKLVAERLAARGLHRTYRDRSLLWLTEVYQTPEFKYQISDI